MTGLGAAVLSHGKWQTLRGSLFAGTRNKPCSTGFITWYQFQFSETKWLTRLAGPV